MPVPGLEGLDIDALLADGEGGQGGDNPPKGDDDADKDDELNKGGDDDHQDDDDADKGGKPSGDDDDANKGDDPKPELDLDDTADLQKAIEELKKDPLSDLEDDWQPANWKELIQKSADVAEKRRLLNEKENELQARNNQKADAEARAEFEAEIARLEKEGVIPKMKAEDEKDPGYIRRREVLQYMIKKNNELGAEKKPYRIMSFEQAVLLLQAEEAKAERAERDRKETELNKKRGSMIGTGRGGGSASQAPSGKGYVAGQTLDDIMNDVLTD